MAGLYNRGKFLIAGTFDWVGGNVQALLVDSGYSYDPDNNFVSDVAGDEVVDGSYGRQTLGSKGITEDDTNDRAILEAAPVDFGALDNVTPAAIILFLQVTTDADSPLISFHDAGFGATANGAGFVVNGEGASDNEWVYLEECV